MPNNKYTEITNTVYKILEYFPEGELLRNKAKEKALKIMEDLVSEKIDSQVLSDIEMLKSYLILGKSQGWIDNLNLMILLKEYDKIKEEIKPMAVLAEKSSFAASAEVASATKAGKATEGQGKEKIPVDNFVSKKEKVVEKEKISGRQQEIIKVLETQGKAQVADLKRVLPNVSKRTLRRDLDVLLKIGKIERIGEWNQVFYQVCGGATPVEINRENTGGTGLLS